MPARAGAGLHADHVATHTGCGAGQAHRHQRDRLVKALRLAGISDIDAANAWLHGYMAQHNQRFAVAPKNNADMHRPWLGGADKLASICALHHQRQLSAQLSCRFEGQVLQVELNRPLFSGRHEAR